MKIISIETKPRTIFLRIKHGISTFEVLRRRLCRCYPLSDVGTNRLRKSAFMKYQISLNNVVEFDPVFSLPQSMLRFIPLTANIFQVPKVPTRRYPQRDTTRFEHWPHLLLEPYFSTPTSVRPCSKADFMQNSSEQRFKSEFYKFILFC